MATEKEEIILDIKIDQGAAFKQLEQLEKVILNNKEAQEELNKAYKKGNITQDEYIKDAVRLKQNLKQEQDQRNTLIKTINTESNSRNAMKLRVAALTKEYDNLNKSTAEGAKRADALQKELSELNAQISKSSKSAGLFKDQIGNYPHTFAEAAKSINVAGVSVGDIGTKLASFANPATAAIGIVGALGSAYAKSAIGAKDLEFAQNQVSAAFSIASNAFAEFISSAEDGEGIVSSFTNEVLSRFAPGVAGISKYVAQLKEDLEDLGRTEIAVRADVSRRIEENQNLTELLVDDQVSLNEKIQAADTIEKNLLANKHDILKVLVLQLQNLQDQFALNKNDEALLTIIEQKKAEISREGAAQEKQITRINKQQADLLSKLREEQELREDILRTDIFEANAPKSDLSAKKVSTKVLTDTDARIELAIKEAKIVEQTEAQKQAAYKATLQIQQVIQDQQIATAKNAADAAAITASIFGEQTAAYKIAASAATIISTYSSATKAYESAFLPFPTVASPALGAASAAVAVATGLANLARINEVQFAAGGYTGPGFGKPDHTGFKPAGYVHEHEYVVPKRVNLSPAAQPHIAALESMRLRPYSDGGLVTAGAVAETNQALITANSFKNLPQPVLEVVEFNRVAKRVAVKEKVSRL